MEKYQVWCEGYATNGQIQTPQRLTRRFEETLWDGETFNDACENALRTLKWDMSYYNKEQNTYWSCRFFDNEIDAKHNITMNI